MSFRELWEDPRLRKAWAEQDWAAIFKEFRRAARISQQAMEPLVGMPQPHISAIERGRRQITSAEVRERITRGLCVPEELGGLPARRAELSEWMPDAELRERIALAHSRHRVDLRAANRIALGLAQHRRTEDVLGGRAMWVVVRAQLDAVTAMLPDAAGSEADRLLALAAEHAHWLAWVADQEGRRGASLAWLDFASGWAMESASWDLVSWLARVRSHVTLRRDDPIRALRLAEAARHAPGPLSPAAESIAAHAEAMAAAAVAERDRAQHCADRALQLALAVEDEHERPDWLYWLSPSRARLQRADVAYAVRSWADAAAGYAAELPSLVDYPRDHAYYEQRLADARSRV